MHVTFEHDAALVVAAVRGEMDADNCADLGTRLTDGSEGSATFVIDLAELTFIDSSGIAELLRVGRTAAERGQHFKLRQPSPAVHRVLEITGLLEHFGLD